MAATVLLSRMIAAFCHVGKFNYISAVFNISNETSASILFAIGTEELLRSLSLINLAAYGKTCVYEVHA